MAALKEQITALEAEIVALEKWTLVGEASARNRPKNSLLEQDLDSERVAKAVLVVTEEGVQKLEEMIKSRILANDYDDVRWTRNLSSQSSVVRGDIRG
jgi:U3 small nucleolar RNA-associated protein MPP10